MTVTSLLIVVLLLSLCLGAFFSYIALWSRHHKTNAGGIDLLGMRARVSKTLQPDGAIIVDGELWRARVRHFGLPVLPGRLVHVVGADGHLLLVESMD